MSDDALRYGMVMTTAPNRADAERIADMLIERRLAACVQLITIDSRYRWKGEIAREGEVLLLAKTKASLFEAAIAAIREIHPYAVPEIVASAFVSGLPAYFAWIEDETR